MDKNEITRLHKRFEDVAHTEDGVEFWYARDIQLLLEYTQWRNFEQVIEKAQAACKNSGQQIPDHFADVSKTIEMPKGATKAIDDMRLTRYACYLIAQNGDPRKPVIAFAKTYLALKASETELSDNIYQRGVDSQGFARIRSKGDQALFGGKNTADMKRKLAIPDSRPLADFLPTVTIAAKNFAAEITNHNVQHNDLYGEPSITTEHEKNNINVRGLLLDSGIRPEILPPEEDIKKLERRVKSQGKALAKTTGILPSGKEEIE